ncbi:MAG: calcium/sodium antiporter [Acidimicrobiia bacterium]|nr:calcium/sodium antiporter [Acidimicrobiia bacterium]
MAWAVALVVGGLVLLTAGADRFVLAAARLSRIWGLSPILIGALVVGMGTSAPEFLVSVVAAAGGGLDLAVGNVIGSNVANLSLVLGATALVAPLAGQIRTLRREGLLMAAAVALLVGLTWDRSLTTIEGVILIGAMLVAAALLVRWARLDVEEVATVIAELDQMTYDAGRPNPRFEIIVGITALIATLGGAEMLVRGAQTIARELDLSEGFIGLTVVALGTSLPELATALAAARRREHDLVVGNLLGSNLFNSLAVAGVAAVVGGGALTAGFSTGLLFMLGVAAFAGILTATGNKLVRWEGFALIAVYLAFVVAAF